jgi:Flp pilus assembly protein TadD
MRDGTHTGRALVAALLLVVAAPAHGSERSDLLVSQGQAAYHARRLPEARDRFAAAVDADPRDPAAQYGLGLTLAKLERWEDARAPLEKAIELRPDFPQARRALGLVLLHVGEEALARKDYATAASLFDRAAELTPKYAGRSRYLAGVARARAGQADQARADFQAAARMPDPEAAAAAGTYAERLGEGGEGAAAKRWEVRGLAGFQYDSNPSLEPHNVHDRRDEATFVLGAHGRYDVVQQERALVRLDYDFYQTLLPTFEDFQFRAHQAAGTASWAVRRGLWLGVQGGYNHYSLGSHQYLQEPFVLPFVSFAEGAWGRTQLHYRHGESDYLSSPFDGIRDGQTNGAAINQLVLFSGGARYLTFGYQFEREEPDDAVGSDWERDSNQAHVGVGFPAWWKTAVELIYAYRNDDYDNRNSFDAPLNRVRVDDEHRFYAGAKRTLTEHLNVTLAYRGIINTSNIGLFDYRRNVASLLFEVTF